MLSSKPGTSRNVMRRVSISVQIEMAPSEVDDEDEGSLPC